jgi:glucose/arabinose dehydrogenase
MMVLVAAAACAQSAPATSLPGGEATDVESSTQPGATSAVGESPSETPTFTPEPLPASLPDPNGYDWVLVSDGFTRPLLLTHAGDGSGRLFVVEQAGRIRVIENGAVHADPFLDLTTQVGSEGNEQGLLGLAFHPDFEQNGLLYIDYTDLSGNTVVSRFQVSANANQADGGSEQVLLQVDQPFANHNGGNLAFGPDGYLYIGLGDGGSQGDPNGNGQSPDTLLGKILRIDVNGGAPYVIPVDNPFGRGGGLGEIWALGFRNPWRFTFDSATGDMFVGDVGQGDWEEIDFLPLGTAAANFGWNYFEGTHTYEGSPPADAVLIPPVAEYEHGSTRCSVTGGYVYRGTALPAWQGVYLYADYCSGEIWGLVQHADGTWESGILYDTSFLVTSFGRDEAGEIYIVHRGGGIYQLQTQ